MRISIIMILKMIYIYISFMYDRFESNTASDYGDALSISPNDWMDGWQ